MRVACEALPSADGVLCLVCVDEDGRETELACCDYVRPTPPPCRADVTCESSPGGVSIGWNITPGVEDCCDRLELRDRASGVLLGVVPDGVRSLQIPCDRFPAQSGRVCLVCVTPRGNRRVLGCCDYECADAPPCAARLRCESLPDVSAEDAGFALRWTLSDAECCQRFEIRDRDTGELVVRPEAGANEVRVRCSDLPANRGVLCLVCVGPEGERRGLACCPYVCPDVDPDSGIRCSPTPEGLAVEIFNSFFFLDFGQPVYTVYDVATGAVLWEGNHDRALIPWDALRPSGRIRVTYMHPPVDAVMYLGRCSYERPGATARLTSHAIPSTAESSSTGRLRTVFASAATSF